MGINATCRDCVNEKARARYAAKDILSRRKQQKSNYDKERRGKLRAEGKLKPLDPGTAQMQMLRRNYGMTPDDYDAMVAEQSNQTLKNIEDVLTRRGILTVPLRNTPIGP